MEEQPYLHVVDEPRVMRGKGAPRSTVFGVIGRTKIDPFTKTLGGLVVESTKGVRPEKVSMKASAVPKNTDRKIVGAAAKTKIPGAHMGQVPYAGKYMSDVGERL